VSKTRRFAVHDSPGRHVSYLLGRLVRCEHCGSNFVGRRREYTNYLDKRVVNTAYYCSGYLFKGSSVCRSLPIDQAWLDGVVLEAIRARIVDLEGWQEIEGSLLARIEERRRLYKADPRAVAQKIADLDRRIVNYYKAIGDGLDPTVCKGFIAELTQKKAEIEREAETLQTEDYYTKALEQNLAALERFRTLFGEAFEELPFGVRRQAVLVFVEGIAVRERREVVVTLKVPLDNAGISHLSDEVEAVQKGTWRPKDEEGSTASGEPSYEGSPKGQSGQEWWAIQDSNL
jgi:hypothetical protein